MKELTFLATVSVAEFKAAQGVAKLDVIKNPHTGKNFFVCGSTTGAVAKQVDFAIPCSVSRCVDANGVEIHILHNTATSSNIVVSL